ncbi:mitochondrial import inner membrane translocase subunit TIM44-2-like isoform X1 [Carex rostrata]
MATSTLLRVLRRSSCHLLLTPAQIRHLQLPGGYKHTTNRHLSVFKEFSKHLKGEANSNPEFQKSVKELNEKIGVVTDDLKVKTKKTAEKVYKSVDEVWTEAEETSKKVSASVKEKISAAKEEVKETFGLGKEHITGTSQGSEPNPNQTSSSSSESSSQDASTSSTNQQGQFGYGDIFSKLKSTISSASPAVSSAFQKLKDTKVTNLAKKSFEMVRDELSADSKTRTKKMQQAAAASGERSTRTEVVVVPIKRSVLGEKWESLKQKMQGHPMFRKVTGYTKPVVNKGQEIAEDVRERWETSDSPIVHKIQDLNETVFGETATGLSFKEIRRRDPSFSLPDFVSDVQEIIHPVLTAYHKGDLETLKKYCTKEVLERCKGERTAYESQGMFFDKKILHISEVDVRETKMMGSTPIIILFFQTQQIYCVRDKQGEIMDGGKDTILTVYYAWAMQLMDADEAGEESYFPVWRLREMQEQGVQALI